MSEEKLYAVKNDEGKFWEFFDNSGFWSLDISDSPITPSKDQAEQVANEHGGHVATFIEEPKKVVLTKEQAEIVEKAHTEGSAIAFIFINGESDDDELLMRAYVNGYTVKKEKEYNVKVPHTKDVWYYKASEAYLLTICPEDKKLRGEFTESEIEHYGLQDCEKVWCDSDDD